VKDIRESDSYTNPHYTTKAMSKMIVRVVELILQLHFNSF